MTIGDHGHIVPDLDRHQILGDKNRAVIFGCQFGHDIVDRNRIRLQQNKMRQHG